MQFEENTSDQNSGLEESQEDPLVHSITINPESFSDSLKLLQAHGITLQNENDENNILNTVMESGHSVVLTGQEYIILTHLVCETFKQQKIIILKIL